MAILETIAGAIAGPIIGGLFGMNEGDENRAATADANQLNAQTMQAINDRNIAFQQETNAINRAQAYGMAADNARREDFWNIQNAATTREYFQRNEDLQREFARTGIQWRVSDAINAGLHPIYALSGGGASYSPSAYVGSATATSQAAPRGEAPRAEAVAQAQPYHSTAMSQMGQELSRAITAFLNPYERARRDLELKALSTAVDKDEALAQYYRSRAATASQAASSSAPMPWTEAISTPYEPVEMPKGVQLNPAEDYSATYPGKYDVIEPKPVPVYSANREHPYAGAGPASPGWQPVRLTRNMEALMPLSDEGWAESVGELPHSMWGIWLRANIDRYGPAFPRLVIQELGGNTALSRWLSRIGFTEEGSMRGPVYGTIRR